ncbi:hypothetical protein K2173_015093 [Erythroxylum novogranatense]|uniref:AAA+ ATPase domain-containing protein n=1 Tax=Erythroxylum novogranatense TaxID=1862640 RepID=A0AAV8T211_9ROSI|nr:hypothetical protein K2173_015093 [Erythroxylum novogranatense]
MASVFTPSLFHFSQNHKLSSPPIRYRLRTSKFTSKSCRNLPLARVLRVWSVQKAALRSEHAHGRFLDPPASSKQEKQSNFSIGCVTRSERCILKGITRSIVYTLCCIAVGFFSVSSLPAQAFIGPVSGEAALKEELDEQSQSKGHGYSDSTRSLLEEVSKLLKRIEEARKGNVALEQVKLALKAVKTKKEKLQGEIMEELFQEVRELKREKESLMNRADEMVDESMKLRREYENSETNEEKDKMDELEEKMRVMEEEYSGIWERVGKIEDKILRRETMAMSVGIRELCFIERECDELVKMFSQELKRQQTSSEKGPITKLSKVEIQKELETAQRKLLEQKILPAVVDVKGPGPLFDQDSMDFAIRIKLGLRDSSKLQKDLEARMRKKMKKFGDENRFVVKTPEGEVVKGYPEVELKWMFGDKEIVVPKAARLRLYHGWKKWREETKADLKRKLLEDVDFGKLYVAQKQERILLDRDRVIANTWYNDEKKRWEMDPLAVPYVVSKKLVEHVRIRHDWGAMYMTLKGDEKEIYVDVKEFDMLFEDFGGFDGLYMKLLANGIPTAVYLMWIPFSELNFHQQFLLMIRLTCQCLNELWKNRVVSTGRELLLEKIKNLNDDIMMVIIFPTLELLIPFPVRMRLGMAWPEEIGQSVASTWYLRWQSEAEMSFRSRKRDGFQWYFWFIIRTFIYGYIVYHVLRFMKKKIPRLLGFGPLRKNPNLRKLQRVKAYINYKVKRIKRKKKAGIDPIRSAFDRMKRVKNPPIPLKDFASIESMREEISEVVAFLQNPSAFQEMGARAPRGVLIVGERGTGKTSLALAIAAEAKVPVVKVKAQQLEAGLWVGQSASNIRELFQTARDLAPVIIFVEDFDLFAGVRGKFIHTKKQDHEAFINQLLVELDGFEKQDGVVLMATTRNIKQIDEALQRPGRMDRVFYLQQPTQAEREKILHMAAKESMDEDLVDYVDWKKVAEKTALLRPIELKLVPVALEGSAFRSKFLDPDELMSYCSWFATFSRFIPKWVQKTKPAKKLSRMLVNHLGLALTKEDLQNVVDLMEPYGQISNGMELLNPPIDWTREAKFPHAVWAAGRGLIAILLPNFDIVDNLWLEPCSWQGIGCTKISKARSDGSLNGNLESRSYLEKKLVFCFGSYVASQLLLPFGEENFLSAAELKQAQEIATRMVIQYGWGPDDSPAIYFSNNAGTSLSMGNNYEYEMAAKVEKIYDLAYFKAKEMLQKNHRVLENIVEELLEFEILAGKDLERMLESKGGVREKEPFSLSEAKYREPISSSFLDVGNGSGPALFGASA